MKNALKVVLVIILLLLFKFLITITVNEAIIRNYKKDIYKTNLVEILYTFNFNQPYIAYYNHGNLLYRKGNYEDAIERYDAALKKQPPKNKVCDIRINKSLAMIYNIKVTDAELIYEELEKAKNNLYQNNCATPDDSPSLSEQAEKLASEIQELQDQLKENSGGSSNSDPNEGEEDGDDTDGTETIEEELKENERNANENRQNDLTNYENLGDYEYYHGKRW